MLAVVLVGGAARGLAQEAPGAAPVAAPDGTPEGARQLVRIGSFTGAPVESAGEYLDNELFREARSGDLFQELGDLEVSLSQDWSGGEVGASITYSRRVLDRHREMAPGSEVLARDLSWFQTINSARAKTSLDVDYVSDPSSPLSFLGLHAESGFVLTAAETQPPRKLGLGFSRELVDEHLRQELLGYWDSRDARFRKRLLPRFGRSLVTVLEGIASAIDQKFEDTEKGALYFEGFVEPITMFADLGFPLPPELFTTADTRFAAGDGATYTAFLGISPFRVSGKQFGLRASAEAFARLIRETTVIEEENDHVRVRVRTIAARGHQLVPIKVRPEVSLLVFRYGYTFLQDRHDRGRFRVADIVYRFDIGTAEGKQALDDLLGARNRVRPLAPIEAAQRGRGVEIIASELREGDRRDAQLLARFPSWFRVKAQGLALVQDVEEGGETVREAVQGRRRSVRARGLGGKRNHGSTEVLILQATPKPTTAGARAPKGPTPVRALEVRTTVRDRHPDGARRRLAADLWRALPGSPEPPPELYGVERVGMSASFAAGARDQALARFLDLDATEVWQAAAAVVLGPEQTDTWSLPEQRRAWRDRANRADRRRLHRSEDFVRRFEALRTTLAKGEIDASIWHRNRFRRDEFPILLRLVLRAGHEAEAGSSFGAELWTDEMPRPLRRRHGRSPIARIGALSVAEPAPPQAAQTPPTPTDEERIALGAASAESQAIVRDIDSLASAAPRLLAGRMFLTTDAKEAEQTFTISLFSDLRFGPEHRLRIELRRSRVRADVPLAVDLISLGSAEPVPEGPFAISRFRYDVRLSPKLARQIHDRAPYSVYLRVLGADGLPRSEEAPLHFRIPRKSSARKASAPAEAKSP